MARDVISGSTSRSRDGLDLPKVSSRSRSWSRVGRSRAHPCLWRDRRATIAARILERFRCDRIDRSDRSDRRARRAQSERTIPRRPIAN
jgi:hypothetical protein